MFLLSRSARLSPIVDAYNAVVLRENPQLGCGYFVLGYLAALTSPDKLALACAGPHVQLGAEATVTIATFAGDESTRAIFEAVRDAELELFVTGNPGKLQADVAARAPPNVRFTGFLAEEDYWGLLRAADAVVDLTLKPDCLVCGAYEALAVGRPMLLSHNPASAELFGDSALFTDNTVGNIRGSFERLKSERARLEAAVALKRNELTAAWTLRAQRLAEMLRGWCPGIRRER